MEDQKVIQSILSQKISMNKQLEDAVKALETTISKIDKKGVDVMEDVRRNNRTTSPSLNDQLLIEVKVQQMLTSRLNLLICRLIRTI